MPLNTTIHQALQTIRRTLPEAAAELKLDLGEPFAHWIQIMDHKLLPRTMPDFPLVAAICGGGSAGKSTLFNSLMGALISPVGGRAGLNRRVLVGAHEDQLSHPTFMQALEQTFGATALALENPGQLLTPGHPMLIPNPRLPEKIVLLDTPDIDTGSKGRYTNRDTARHSLEVADIFIYIFTNATYNNRDNTDFIARMLTGIGARPCYLVYRVYSGFSDEEVVSHARTVALNLYGASFEKHLLGIYRADEDNAVAAGRKPMTLQPVSDQKESLSTALAELDVLALRRQMLASMLSDALDMANSIANRIRHTVSELEQYSHAMQDAQSHAVRQVLSHFPADQVLRRFAKIWMASDPSHIKLMRRTGRVVGWPMRTLFKTIRKMSADTSPPNRPESDTTIEQRLETDLLNSANGLHQACLDNHVAIDGRRLAAPVAIQPAQDHLRKQPWQTAVEKILARKQQVLHWSNRLDDDLRALARRLRTQMNLFDQIRQTFSALLNVIPATAAVTYILHTGDPAGAAGIKVKLTGLLGLHDLYALVAIPATAGLSKTDRQQLELLLKPLVRTWLEHKYKIVQELFETQISGHLLEAASRAQIKTNELLSETDQALAQCRQAS
jgi:hypothetical protein